MVFIDSIFISTLIFIYIYWILIHESIANRYNLSKLNPILDIQYKLIWVFILILLILSSCDININRYWFIYIIFSIIIYTILVYLYKTISPLSLLLISISLTYSLNISNILDLIILIEIINILILFIILYNINIFINFKKQIYIILVSINILTLVFFIYMYFKVINTYKITSISGIKFLINTDSFIVIKYIIYLTLFIKLGLFLGPIYNQYLYEVLNKLPLSIYLVYYYWIIPIIIIPWVCTVSLSTEIIIIVSLIILLLNINFIKKIYNIKSLIYISGQINLIYIQLLLL